MVILPSARGPGAVADGGLAGLLPADPTQALDPHQPLDGATRNRDARTVELSAGRAAKPTTGA
ncbi:hypothetical protein ACN93_11545 [Gordonia paraffinivorans]|nr:hypothetical protein ACN93_11545 [Gordonia paraffinivorans]